VGYSLERTSPNRLLLLLCSGLEALRRRRLARHRKIRSRSPLESFSESLAQRQFWGADRALLGGDAPEDDGSRALDDFQAFLQELSVSMPKLDIVGGSGSGLKSDRLADDESHGLGFGLAYLLRGQSTAFATM
jgi:hypothetical protein